MTGQSKTLEQRVATTSPARESATKFGLPIARFPKLDNLVGQPGQGKFNCDWAHAVWRHSIKRRFSVDKFLDMRNRFVSAPQTQCRSVAAFFHYKDARRVVVNSNVNVPISVVPTGKVAIARNEQSRSVFHAAKHQVQLLWPAKLIARDFFLGGNAQENIFGVFKFGLAGTRDPNRLTIGRISRHDCPECGVIARQSFNFIQYFGTSSVAITQRRSRRQYCDYTSNSRHRHSSFVQISRHRSVKCRQEPCYPLPRPRGANLQPASARRFCLSPNAGDWPECHPNGVPADFFCRGGAGA
jgi:hypothetical protein